MGGYSVVRGIGYQQAQAVLVALDLLDDLGLGALRVEGAEDVVDIELFSTSMSVLRAIQVKTRDNQYTWGQAELIDVMRRWANLPDANHASFVFLTDGRLGPTGERVRDALAEAGEGHPQKLAEILHVDPASAVCSALRQARVRVDPVGGEELLLRAERQVAAMLPQPRTTADAREQAQLGVGALFRLLFHRGGDPDAKTRVVTREEIAATLGVPSDQPVSQRWPGGVKHRYLRAARVRSGDAIVASRIELEDQVRPSMLRLGLNEDSETLDASALLAGGGPATLAGRTGTGKSTAARTLCRDAADAGRVVLLAHAETYLPGRLEALAADALSGTLAEDLPSATGRQALADREVTLIIDGVSEVPAQVREALREDLLVLISARRGARIIVLGRDVAALREVLPSSVEPISYQMLDLDSGRRLELARRTLLHPLHLDYEYHPQAQDVRTLVAQVEHALGDASGNPLLFTMALSLVVEGIPFTSRATLYERFVERLAARSGASGIVHATAALGIVYARLLDQGRRYADPYEWALLVAGAANELTLPSLPADPAVIDSTIRRCGLIAPIGYTQTLAPIHDSFADYMAGVALARRLAPLPARLQSGDDQRILFAGEIGGVDEALAELAARDQPFLTVRLAEFDQRQLTEESPVEVEALLRRLILGYEDRRVAMWRVGDGRVVAVINDERRSSWVGESEARRLREAAPIVVVEDRGPLAVAVRLWRQDLIARLQPSRSVGAPRPTSTEAACAALKTHAEQTAAITVKLIETVAPPGHASVLASRVGPIGLSATLGPPEEESGGRDWSVSYHHTDDVTVVPTPVGEQMAAAMKWPQGGGRSTVTAILQEAPAAAAAQRVRGAIAALAASTWL